MINLFKSKELVTGALAGRNLRINSINANLANVEFFIKQEILNLKQLCKSANEIFKNDNKEL